MVQGSQIGTKDQALECTGLRIRLSKGSSQEAILTLGPQSIKCCLHWAICSL